MNQLTDCYTLNDGTKIPCIGFGTWQAKEGDIAVTAVRTALEAGYRHIDTAACYGNEDSVGKGIRESGVPREDIYITTKLWNTVRGYNETIEAFHESRNKLGLEYLDLYLIHWPNPANFRDRWEWANAESWRAMEDLVKQGYIRSIGVSNFRPHHLEALAKTANTRPAVNQIRLCPGEVPLTNVNYCRERDILLEAYSPLGTGKIFSVPEMTELADKYGKTVAQICIRFSLQMGFLPLPKSVTPERIADNTKVFDFELSKEDVERILALEGIVGYSHNPDLTNF
ncbi:MAG: aldo/keto reductase [Lachnospiraceae bacterium]|nr:aldo/keto reductase [Lachnospiraceae bacterium]